MEFDLWGTSVLIMLVFAPIFDLDMDFFHFVSLCVSSFYILPNVNFLGMGFRHCIFSMVNDLLVWIMEDRSLGILVCWLIS